MKLLLALTAVAAAYSVNTLAQTERDLDSHVHGSASLNVAISDSFVFIELNTPWNNLVGFEHAPQNDEQRLLVETALQQLDDPAKLFAFNAGECALNETNVEGAMTDELHGDEHGDEHEDEHKTGEEHGIDQDDKHAGDDGESKTHTAVLAIYSYDCKQIDNLNTIDASLFSIWPGFKDLDVQLIGDKGQTLVELDPENTIINIDQVQ